MLPFGVQEIPTSRGKVEPGWAYVADTGINPSQAALRPTNQKRARNLTTAGGAATSQDLYTKQDAKTLRELAQLEKDSFRDAQISIPVRNGVVGRGMGISLHANNIVILIHSTSGLTIA